MECILNCKPDTIKYVNKGNFGIVYKAQNENSQTRAYKF